MLGLFGPLKSWVTWGAIGISALGAAWAAHAVTAWRWEARYNDYVAQVQQDWIKSEQRAREFLKSAMAHRDAKRREYQQQVQALHEQLAQAHGKTRVIYREIPVTDVGECRFTSDGVRLIQRAAAAANGRDPDAAAGSADRGDDGMRAVPDPSPGA